MRLDKFISHATDLSRSQCRAFLKAGEVTVNEQVIADPAYRIEPADIVALQGSRLSLSSHRYFMLYKPAGYVSATTDSEHATALDLLGDDGRDLRIGGRLDIDATGLLLLSDDGQWLHRITSPRRHCEKTYRVELAEVLDPAVIPQFENGITLRGDSKPTKPARLRVISATTVEVILREGRYHQVKRMFAAVGNPVRKLHRCRIGDIALDPALQPGQYRPLTAAEIASV